MGDSFSFQFKDRSKDSVYYVASYSGGDNLKLEKREHEYLAPGEPPIRGPRIPKSKKLGTVLDPWSVFHANATFDDILYCLRVCGRIKPYDEDETEDSFHTYKFFKMKTKDGRDIGTSALSDETFLRRIADNPSILQFHSKSKERLARIIRDAGRGDKEAKEVLTNLIPRHKGGRKRGREHHPHDLKLAGALLKKLANHLSKECKNSLKEEGLWISENVSLTGDDWHENYNRLIEWAKVHEHRISNLKHKHLEELIRTPAHYADSILSGDIQLGVRTIKTP